MSEDRDRPKKSRSCKDDEAAYYEEGVVEAHRQNQLCQTIHLQSVGMYRAIHVSREN